MFIELISLLAYTQKLDDNPRLARSEFLTIIYLNIINNTHFLIDNLFTFD